jgi:hypothetical protein
MTSSKGKLKVTLSSATINTFIWAGNSDPIDVEDAFEDAIDALYQGQLTLMPHKPLDSDFHYPIDSSWTLIHDYTEIKGQKKKDLFKGSNPINRIVQIECDQIKFELEESDYDGFEGDFYYHLEAEIYIETESLGDDFSESTIRDSLYRNLCFTEETGSSRFETDSDDGEIVEIAEKNYLLVPISMIEIHSTVKVPFEDRCTILGQFWYEFRDQDGEMSDFIRSNDVGLPLAWFISTGAVKSLEMGEEFVNETFSLFLESMSLKESELIGIDNLGSLLDIVKRRNQND